MTLEEVVKKALSDNADCLGGECDCVALGLAKAVRGYLLSDEVVKRAGHALQEGWSFADDAGLHALPDIEFSEHEREYLARAALSSITGDE